MGRLNKRQKAMRKLAEIRQANKLERQRLALLSPEELAKELKAKEILLEAKRAAELNAQVLLEAKAAMEAQLHPEALEEDEDCEFVEDDEYPVDLTGSKSKAFGILTQASTDSPNAHTQHFRHQRGVKFTERHGQRKRKQAGGMASAAKRCQKMEEFVQGDAAGL